MLWLYPHRFFEHDRNKHNLQAIEVQSVPPITPTSPHLFRPSPDAEKPGCGGSRCRKRPIWSQPTPSEGRVTRPNSTGEEQNSRRQNDDCVIFWKNLQRYFPFFLGGQKHGNATMDLNPQRKNSKLNSNCVLVYFGKK